MVSTAEIRELTKWLQERADRIENIGTADLMRDLRLLTT
jgi:hypothetical protein